MIRTIREFLQWACEKLETFLRTSTDLVKSKQIKLAEKEDFIILKSWVSIETTKFKHEEINILHENEMCG